MRYEKRTAHQVGDNDDATAVVAIDENGYEDEIAVLSTESFADRVIEMLQVAGGDTPAVQTDSKRTTREQWMIGITITAIANAINAAYCAYNEEIEAVNEDPDYIAKVAAVVARESSTWQLESLQNVIEAAIPLCAAQEQPRPSVGR